MADFDHLLRIVEGFYNIELKMLGATMEQARGAQAFWIGVFRCMNELMRPFVVFQTVFVKEEKQGAPARTIDRQSPLQEKAAPVPIKTRPVSEEASPGSDMGAAKDRKTPEPMMTRNVVTRVRAGRKAKAPVPAVETAPSPVVTGETPEPPSPAAQLVFSSPETSPKAAPAGRIKPLKARSSVTPSGKSPSLNLKRFSKIRVTGKKLRTRGG